MIRAILFVLLLASCHHVRAAPSCGVNMPGVRECTDDELNPYAALLKKAPLFAKTIRSVGYVCDRVDAVSQDNAPGIVYYHVRCNGSLRYTIGASRTRAVVWANEFTDY